MAECHGCGNIISDKYILRVSPDLKWHQSCLRCTECDVRLSDLPSCFINDGKPYCKEDYEGLFKSRCKGCSEVLEKNSLVMKVSENIFHVDCFVCAFCGDRLLPGDRFSVSPDGHLFCTLDNCSEERNVCSDDCWSDGNSVETRSSLAASHPETEHLEPSPVSQDPESQKVRPKTTKNTTKSESTSPDGKPKLTSKKNSKEKPTRVRTVLNEKQLSTLKRCYAANPRPDSVMKEQLVDMTGLSPRVIRVWFQNKRCKDKKKSMLLSPNDSAARDMMQSQYSLQSPSLSDELSLPGCSPPLSSAGSRSVSHMSSNGNSFVDQAVHNLHLMVNERNYRNVASFPNYTPWRKYDDYQHSYQDGGHSSGHYRSLVT